MDRDIEIPKKILKEMFSVSVDSVLPHKIIENQVRVQDKNLYVGDRSFLLNENVYFIGFGKAVMGMAIALEIKMKHVLKKGIISVPPGSKMKMTEIFGDYESNSVLEFYEGGHLNQPDVASLETTEKIIEMTNSLTVKDTLIVLISGGGSTLLCKPHPDITLEQKQRFCKTLQDAGADISELNAIRIRLSAVKGGRLLRKAYPVPVISLILSDIVNDPIHLIASGPTVRYRENNSKAALEEVESILRKYKQYDSLSPMMKRLLMRDADAGEVDNQRDHDVSNIVVGNNALALDAVRKRALKCELRPLILSSNVVGDVVSVSVSYAEVVDHICQALESTLSEPDFIKDFPQFEDFEIPQPKIKEIYDTTRDSGSLGMVLIGGGEPTVKVTGKGRGGRNQELALRFSLDWKKKIKSRPMLRKYDVVFLSAGTDGQDGSSEAAGAFGYPQIYFSYMLLKEKFANVRKSVLMGIDRSIDHGALNMYKEFIRFVDGNGKPKNVEKANVDAQNYCYDDKFLDKLQREIDKLNPETILANNDSHTFYSRFKKSRDLVKTGITGTNVMDIHLIYIRKKHCKCCVDSGYTEAPSNPFTEHDLSFDEKDDESQNDSVDSTARELPKIKVLDRNLARYDC